MQKEGVRMKKTLIASILALIILFGAASIAGACVWWFYQPELPQKPQ